MKYLIILCLSCFMGCAIQAQNYHTVKDANKKALKAYQYGQRHSQMENHQAAIEELSKAIRIDKRFINAYLLRADAYYASKQFDKAEADFEKILAMDENYNTRIFYVLGLLEYKVGKFDEAVEHLEKFNTFPQKSERLKKQAAKALKSAKFAEQAAKNPVPFNPENLGAAINSKYAEYLPALTVDGNTLIYTRRAGNQEDFYISRKKADGTWGESKDLGEPINTPDNEGAQTISANGKILVYTVCNRPYDYGSCDLYIADLKNGIWANPSNMGPPLSTPSLDSHPSLSGDGSTLYFTSSREGGKGGKDIWMTTRKENGDWNQPISLNINTKGHDETPFIHPDGQTLYFSSNGYPGMGAADLYYSRKQADGTWGEPQNLGYPINTVSNEGALTVSFDGSTAFFASDRPGGYGAVDIYSFDLYEAARPLPVTYVKAVVFDADTKEKLKANVEIVALETGNKQVVSRTDEEGEFLVTLPLGKDYALNIAKKTYLFHSENFALKETQSIDEPFVLEIGLQKIPETEPVVVSQPTEKPKLPKAKPIILKNIFFETASAELLPVSKIELNRLRDLLLENKTLKIQINGHTDNVGADDNNQKLSEARAKSVVDYLIEEGVENNRLTWKGYGETQPIDTNDTEIGRKNNRRTEFIVK